MPRPLPGEIPSFEERARRMTSLVNAPALPILDLALFLDLPLSTIDKLRAEGRGPKLFKLGRRLYISQDELRAWLARMSQEAA